MPPAARMNDAHTCPMTDPSAHGGGTVMIAGKRTVYIGGQLAAVAQDICTCVGSPNMISKGSSSVMIDGRAAARQTDPTAHGGLISSGFPKVIIGG